MDQVTLRAEPGRPLGSRPSRRLRAGGLVPAVLYGRGLEPLAVSVEHAALRAALSTEAGLNAVINLDVDGAQHLTVARELQRDALRGDVKHLDFVKVSLTETILAEVIVHFTGEPIGVSEDGGVGETVRNTITVSALPTDIPSGIEVDVSELHLGDSVKLSDVPEIADVIFVDDPDGTLYTVIAPRAVVEEVVEEELVEGEEVEGEVPEAEDGAETPSVEDAPDRT